MDKKNCFFFIFLLFSFSLSFAVQYSGDAISCIDIWNKNGFHALKNKSNVNVQVQVVFHNPYNNTNPNFVGMIFSGQLQSTGVPTSAYLTRMHARRWG